MGRFVLGLQAGGKRRSITGVTGKRPIDISRVVGIVLFALCAFRMLALATLRLEGGVIYWLFTGVGGAYYCCFIFVTSCPPFQATDSDMSGHQRFNVVRWLRDDRRKGGG